MTTIESRLAAVERQLHFHRLVILGLLIALVALVSYGATEGVPEEIAARSFKVVNKEGKVAFLVVADEEGQGRLEVSNKEGRTVVVVAPNDEGQGQLILSSREWTLAGVVLSGMTATGGGGCVVVLNKTGEAVVQILADEYGMGYVGAFDRQGKGRTLTPR